MRDQPGQVRFHDGQTVVADLPANTMDPRYWACTEHRTGCDCREAEYREELHELRSEANLLLETATTVLASHKVYICCCTGCVIIRAVGWGHRLAWPVKAAAAPTSSRTEQLP